MSKVKCRVCANELSGVCKIKKVSVAINKPRTCSSFVYDETKIKIRETPPSVKLSYTEKEKLRKVYREELRVHRERAIAEQKNAARNGETGLIKPTTYSDGKHPLTGDLSRFTTTAKKSTEPKRSSNI